MKYLSLCTCLLFTGCTSGVVNSLSDVNNSFKSLTNQTITNKILVKNAFITKQCIGKSEIVKKVNLNDLIYTKVSSENEKWLDVYESLESGRKIGCVPKTTTNYKEIFDSLSDLSGNTLDIIIKTEKEQFKEKGFSKEEKKNFSSKKGFTIENINSEKKLFTYEYSYISSYLSELNKYTSTKEFAINGGLN